MALSLSGDGTLSGVDIAASGLGKVLQVVRATDSTDRSTTSTSFVDVTGMSVTITPTKNTSAVLIVAICNLVHYNSSVNETYGRLQITDSSNNAISGAETTLFGVQNYTRSGTAETGTNAIVWGYATPATTSAVTYKLRFLSRLSTTTSLLLNGFQTGQLFAIEVAA